MEQETILKEILTALKLHSEHVDTKFQQMDSRFEQMDKRFEQMDKRFDRLEKKVDGIRMDLTETQKTTNFILGKISHHEEKLLQLSEQQK